jgi:hypothetical protein
MVAEFDSGAQRRRSPRLEKHIPVRLAASLGGGQHVDQEAVVNQVSSHGVRLTIGVDLPSGTVVEIHNPQTQGSARYRVMWVAESPGGERQMGLELVSESAALWGIDFSHGEG